MKLNLKRRFLIPTVILLVSGLGISSIISYFISGDAIENCIVSQLVQLADSGEKQLYLWIKTIKKDIYRLSHQSYIVMSVRDSFIGIASRRASNAELVKEKKKHTFYESANVANQKGKVVSSSDDNMKNTDVSEQEYFRKTIKGAEKGKAFLSDVFASPVSGKPVFVVAYPIYDKKVPVGVLFGVVSLDDFKRLCIDSVKVGQRGHAYMVNRDGFAVIHPDQSLIMRLDTKADHFGREMMTKERGVLFFTLKDVKRVMGFKRNAETGWTIVICAEIEDVMSPVIFLRQANFFVAIFFVILLTIIIRLITKSLIRPLNSVVAGLTQVSGETALFSHRMSSGSQKLAQNSSQQTSAAEETAASMKEMLLTAIENLNRADHADTLMKEANTMVEDAARSMERLVTAMSEISKAGQETYKIVNLIDEIAFQTKILSLNAAVEAGRAGQAGAGFGVVANEFRNLAMRTSQAAKSTAKLIEGVIDKVREGTDIADYAGDAFSRAVERASMLAEVLEEIKITSKDQAMEVDQVNSASEDLDRASRENAVQAQEYAAVSEEMNTQIVKMKGFVDNITTLVEGQNGHNVTAGRYPRYSGRVYAGGVVKGKNAPSNSRRDHN